MGTWIHRIKDIDEELRTATCQECGPVKIQRKGRNKKGKNKWRCTSAKRYQKRPHSKHKGLKCEECGFIPVHLCQLDVDHIDGNKDNNEVSNYRTLCANCHRLKTYLNKDWEID